MENISESNIKIDTLSSKSKLGGIRGDVFVNKLKNNEPFEFDILKNKKKFSSKIINRKEILAEITNIDGKYNEIKAKSYFNKGIQYKKIIKAEDGELYKLNDIIKTTEFGSSGGTSLGTKGTLIVESFQCLFLAYRQKLNKQITEKRANDIFDHFDDIIGDIKIPENVSLEEDTLDEFKSWIPTFIKTSNVLYDGVKFQVKRNIYRDNILSGNYKYIFYQISHKEGLNKSIVSAYRRCEETKGIPISKWTPSDVWAVAEEFESVITKEIDTCYDIVKLNQVIDKYFNLNQLVGISLKKVATTKEKVNIVINKETPTPTYRYSKCGTSNDPFKTISTKIIAYREQTIVTNLNGTEVVYKGGHELLNIRNSSGSINTSDINAEIVGKSARHGKCGLTQINMILRRYNIQDTITKHSSLKLIGEDSLKELIIALQPIVSGIPYTEIVIKNKTSISNLISKYQSLKLCALLIQNTNVADNIVNDIFQYAMAIRNDKYTCPKYTRII